MARDMGNAGSPDEVAGSRASPGFRPALVRHLAAVLGWVVLYLPALAQTGGVPASSAPPKPEAYFIATPQLDDPLRPLMHLPPDGIVDLHATVATVPDPVETHLGRTFDMEVAALLSAYQAKGYALDGFAFSWSAKETDPELASKARSTSDHRNRHRAKPSVLLFRNDVWREEKEGVPAGAPAVKYDLVFLVGDSPSYGIQPQSFVSAARCALLLNGRVGPVSSLMPEKSCDASSGVAGKLNIIGPSFSASMQSLAAAIARLGCEDAGCAKKAQAGVEVQLVSPSASVTDNANIAKHGFLAGGYKDKVHYTTMAWSLDAQLISLVKLLCAKDKLPNKKIVFLAEESTFGATAQGLAPVLRRSLEIFVDNEEAEARAKQAANKKPRTEAQRKAQWEREAARRKGAEQIRRNCLRDDDRLSVQAVPFSPNIASIRAEHSQLRNRESAGMPKIPTRGSRLLELDMTKAEFAHDRPMAYQPGLSSRSDELMLYRQFDAMRMWGKPDVVVIVATDIRDRLFLLSEVRKALPSALPTMLELDYLVVHPDYRNTSRGAVVVPTREPMVCMKDGKLDSCDWSPKEHRCWPFFRKLCRTLGLDAAENTDNTGTKQEDRKERARKDRNTFSTDHAANTFRAAVLLIAYRDEKTGALFDDFAAKALCAEGDVCEPEPYMATLAGFEALAGQPHGTMAAADVRLAMQRPWYIVTAVLAGFFLMIGVWLWLGMREGRVLYNFVRHLIVDSRWLTRRLPKWAKIDRDVPRLPPVEYRAPSVRARDSLVPSGHLLAAKLLVLLACVVLPLALWRLWRVGLWQGWLDLLDPCLGDRTCRFKLAHGRDVAAVICLWLLYGCLCLIGAMRLDIADRRYIVFGGQLQWPGVGENHRPWLIPVLILLTVAIAVYFSDSPPVSIDSRVPWLFAIAILAAGVAFLINLGWLLRELSRFTLSLSRCIPFVQERKGMEKWPAAQVLLETAQTPFNLSLRERDVAALLRRSPYKWMRTTRRVLRDDAFSSWPSLTDVEFLAWQNQLVAELKLQVVAIRTTAWCAMAGPLVVLLAMSAYTPVYERWLKTASIFLLLTGFLGTTFTVLRLEKDPMLGPMYTRHGDDLSFGGALRALWPKFVAMGAVLIPLVLPDVWTWLHTLIRSINTLG